MPTAHLISCIGVDSDLPLLPHFLRHYLALGIPRERMHLILNAAADSPAMTRAQEMLTGFGIEPAVLWIAPYTSDAMWAERRKLQARTVAPGDWLISADVDEFHEYPESLERFLGYCERRGVDCVQGVFIDRLAVDGRLRSVTEAEPLWSQFPLEADVICRIGQTGEHHDWYGTVKLMALRGHLLPSRGGHHPQPHADGISYLFGRPLAAFPGIAMPAFRFSVPLRVHHFHWTGALPDSLRRRLATPGVSAAGREYGAKLLDHFEQNAGIALSDIAIRGDSWSVDGLPWRAGVNTLRLASRLHRMFRRGRGLLRTRRP